MSWSAASRLVTVTGLLAALGCASSTRTAPENPGHADVPPSAGRSGSAFVGVTVLSMESERVLTDQIVVVRDGRISEIGPSTAVSLPPGTARIDGHGLFLMPGLADMHAHFLEEDAYFPLFLAGGVTTVRVMGTPPDLRSLRDEVKRGARLGPTLYLVGQLIDGDPPVWEGSAVATTPDQARRAVDAQKSDGYDVVKVYDNLELGPYDAVIEEARRVGIPVAGHVPHRVGLGHVLAAHQRSIEHLNGYFEWLQRPDSPLKGHEHQPHPAHGLWPPPGLIDHLDESRLPEIAATTARAGSWVVPTLVLTRNMMPPEEAAQAMTRPTVRYITPMLRRWWSTGIGHVSATDWAAKRRGDELRRRIVRALGNSGVRLLTGTDSPHPFVVPGFAVHDEIEQFVEAGLTPYQALSAATRNAAEFMSASGEFGVVARGARADLLLLEANPLEDVRNLSRIAGVMVRGHWLPREELQRGLDRLAATSTHQGEPQHHHP
jgi:hypothetical protein